MNSSSSKFIAQFSLSVDMLLANDDKYRYPWGGCWSILFHVGFELKLLVKQKGEFQVVHSKTLLIHLIRFVKFEIDT